MKIVTVVGARPQFVKAAAISRRLADPRYRNLQEILVHTGQHYDPDMSDVFFSELSIPKPAINLGVGPGPHYAQTAAMMAKLGPLFFELAPDLVLVYGDTNSTLAAALVAAKAGLALAHVEAGLRSFRRSMPEEINRIVTDRLAQFLFCPSRIAAEELAREGIKSGVHVSGDVMYDVFQRERDTAIALNRPQTWGVQSGRYLLVTLHRAENTDGRDRLALIVQALARIADDMPVVFPVHPRTRKAMAEFGLSIPAGIKVLPPVSYRDMISLLCSAAAVATDSGGLQKEAYFAAVPCVTLRDETEWVETMSNGWNRLAPPVDGGAIVRTILDACRKSRQAPPPPLFGDGDAAGKILDVLADLPRPE